MKTKRCTLNDSHEKNCLSVCLPLAPLHAYDTPEPNSSSLRRYERQDCWSPCARALQQWTLEDGRCFCLFPACASSLAEMLYRIRPQFEAEFFSASSNTQAHQCARSGMIWIPRQIFGPVHQCRGRDLDLCWLATSEGVAGFENFVKQELCSDPMAGSETINPSFWGCCGAVPPAGCLRHFSCLFETSLSKTGGRKLLIPFAIAASALAFMVYQSCLPYSWFSRPSNSGTSSSLVPKFSGFEMGNLLSDASTHAPSLSISRREVIGVEAIRGSDLRTDEQGSRLDHSRCSPFVAVDMTAAVREHFAFDIDFGIVPDIGIAGMGTVPGCIGANTLQWGSSPAAGLERGMGWHVPHCESSGSKVI